MTEQIGPMTPKEIDDLRSPTHWCACANWATKCPGCGAHLESHDPPVRDPTYTNGDRVCRTGCGRYFWVDQMPLVRSGGCVQCRLLATVDFLLGRDL